MKMTSTPARGLPSVRRATFPAVVGLVAVASCARLLGADFDGKRARVDDGGTGAIVDSSLPDGPEPEPKPEAGGSPSCGVIVSANPQFATEPGDLPDLWFAYRSVDLGDTATDAGLAADSVGMDLPGANACRRPSWATRSDQGPTGIDNAAARGYLDFYRSAPPASVLPMSVLANLAIIGGVNSQLVRIRGWNGNADDPRVEVAFFDGSMGPEKIDTGFAPPKWGGQDVWYASITGVRDVTGLRGDCPPGVSPCYEPVVVGEGAVKERRLSLENVQGSRLSLIDQFRWQATIEGGPSSPRLTGGVIGGRVLVSTFYEIAGAAGDDKGGFRLCLDDDLFCGPGGLHDSMCSRVDVDSDGDGWCDALSAGSTFVAEPIRFGCPVDYGLQPSCPSEIHPRTLPCGQRCDGSPQGGG